MAAVSAEGNRGAPTAPQTLAGPNQRGGIKGNGWHCAQCGTDRTPLKRRGPDGPSTLCNACGMKYSKSVAKGREVDPLTARPELSRPPRAATPRDPAASEHPLQRAVPSERKAASAAHASGRRKRKRTAFTADVHAGSVEQGADGAYHTSIVFNLKGRGESRIELGPFDSAVEAHTAQALVERALAVHSMLPSRCVPCEVPRFVSKSLGGDEGIRRVVDTTAISMHEAGLPECVGTVNGVAMRLFGIEASLNVVNETGVGFAGWSRGYFDQSVLPDPNIASSGGINSNASEQNESERRGSDEGRTRDARGNEPGTSNGNANEKGKTRARDSVEQEQDPVHEDNSSQKQPRDVPSRRADCTSINELLHATLGITPVQALEAQSKLQNIETGGLSNAAELMRLLNLQEDEVRHDILRNVYDIRSKRLRNQLILAAEKAPLADDESDGRVPNSTEELQPENEEQMAQIERSGDEAEHAVY